MVLQALRELNIIAGTENVFFSKFIAWDGVFQAPEDRLTFCFAKDSPLKRRPGFVISRASAFLIKLFVDRCSLACKTLVCVCLLIC